MALASAALNSARTYLNDQNQQIWTDPILIPFLQEAYKDLLLVLWLNGLPVVREKAASITVPAGSLNLGVNQPADLLEPIWIKERQPGSSEDWIPMIETDFEPDWQAENTLRWWTWREEKINFVGATVDRAVLIQYMKTLSMPVVATDPLNFIYADFFLGPQTAGYAANSVGNTTLSKECMWIQGIQVGFAGAKLDMIIRSNVKGQQNLPARRIPYRRFARTRLLL
jgi:hypothetical protein